MRANTSAISHATKKYPSHNPAGETFLRPHLRGDCAEMSPAREVALHFVLLNDQIIHMRPLFDEQLKRALIGAAFNQSRIAIQGPMPVLPSDHAER